MERKTGKAAENQNAKQASHLPKYQARPIGVISLHDSHQEGKMDIYLSYETIEGTQGSGKLTPELPLERIRSVTFECFINNACQVNAFPKLLYQMPALESLKFQSCNIKELPEDIDRLSGLRELTLYETQIEALPDSFSKLKNLNKLTLISNRFKLDGISTHIKPMKHLSGLSMGNGRDSGPPPDIFSIHHIENLQLNFSSMTDFPCEARRLKKLKALSIVAPLSNIPGCIGEFASLESLKFMHHKIKNMPPEIGRLDKLREIAIPGGRISEIPASFVDLKNLESIDLELNSIKQFPSVGHLKHLRILRLRANKLTELPDGLDKLEHLEAISFDTNANTALDRKARESCRINHKTLSVEFPITATEQQNLALEELRIFGASGKIDQDTAIWLRKLTKLRKLSIEGEHVELPVNFVMPQVHELELENIVNEELPFQGFTSLETLNFRSHADSNAHPIGIHTLSNLKELYLTINNGLHLEGNPVLKTLHISFSGEHLADCFDAFPTLEKLTLTALGIPELPPSIDQLRLKSLDLHRLDKLDAASTIKQIANIETLEELEFYQYPCARQDCTLPEEVALLRNVRALTFYGVSPYDHMIPDLNTLTRLHYVAFDGEIVDSETKKALKLNLPNKGKGWKQLKHPGNSHILEYSRPRQ